MQQTDILIIGGGIAGTATTCYLVGLCWLLGISVQKIRNVRQHDRSRLSHHHYKEMHLPRKWRAGKPTRNEHT